MKVDAKLNNKSCLVLRRIGCVLAVMFFGMSVKDETFVNVGQSWLCGSVQWHLEFHFRTFFCNTFLVALKHVWQSIDLHTFVCQSVADKFMLLHWSSYFMLGSRFHLIYLFIYFLKLHELTQRVCLCVCACVYVAFDEQYAFPRTHTKPVACHQKLRGCL